MKMYSQHRVTFQNTAVLQYTAVKTSNLTTGITSHMSLACVTFTVLCSSSFPRQCNPLNISYNILIVKTSRCTNFSNLFLK